MPDFKEDDCKQRLSVLELARKLGNVSEACRKHGISRQAFYVYKKRFEQEGVEGLRTRPTIPKSHPMATTDENTRQIIKRSLENPSLGCNRLVERLEVQGISISHTTVQRHLNKQGLGTQRERWLYLEREAAGGKTLTPIQIRFVKTHNPQFRERDARSASPGAVLCQGALRIGRMEGVTAHHLYFVVDTFNCYAFCSLYDSIRVEQTLLSEQVLPFYGDLGTTVRSVNTVDHHTFSGMAPEDFTSFLSDRGIAQTDRLSFSNGFAMRFRETLREEFLEPWRKRTRSGLPTDLLDDLDSWLRSYNNSRPLLGYPNMGATPMAMIRDFFTSERPSRG